MLLFVQCIVALVLILGEASYPRTPRTTAHRAAPDTTTPSVSPFTGRQVSGQPLNRAPVAVIADVGAAVLVRRPVVLDGSASTDPDGTPLVSYQWRLVARPLASAATLTGATPLVTFVPDVAGRYTVQLTVTDGLRAHSSVLTFATANRPPVAAIAVPAPALVARPLRLDGIGSSDPDDDRLTYAWSVTSRPAGSQAMVQHAGAAIASVTPDRAGTGGRHPDRRDALAGRRHRSVYLHARDDGARCRRA